MTHTLFAELFPHQRAFLPVIHAESAEQVLRNARIAHEEGADGVFLINHDVLKIPCNRLISLMRLVQGNIPGFPVGLNFMDLYPVEMLHAVPLDTPMLWCDDGGIYPQRKFPRAAAEEFENIRLRLKWEGLYFGGVAFKGQDRVDRPEFAAGMAANLIDVITTSGERTGVPPSAEKIRSMAAACGHTPLAIASGMSSENVGDYPGAKAFLVSTSLCLEEDEFDRGRVRAFREAVR